MVAGGVKGSEDSDQVARQRRLIRVFNGRTCINDIPLFLKCNNTVFIKKPQNFYRLSTRDLNNISYYLH